MKRAILALLILFSSTTAAVVAWSPDHATASTEGLQLHKGDHICLIGNTLAERMQHHGRLETLIHTRFPQHELVFRNLGFSGDELTLRLRSAGFGTPDEHLAFSQADVIFAFFGYNESYGGEAGLERFKQDLDAQLKQMLSQNYNGKTPPRIVLFSPIAHEDVGDRNLPDGRENNRRLALYTSAMAEVAAANQVQFVDLFEPSQALYDKSDKPLTINGIHLNEHGDALLAGAIDESLFGKPKTRSDAAALDRLQQAVLDKNFYWYERYRTVDGYSIYGGRADLVFVDGQTNREVMQRELAILDAMTANRDRRVWAVAQGGELEVDDGNTPPFIPVKSNLPGPGPGGRHLFLGGEEGIAKLTVHSGMAVNLFASEEMFPELANPVQIAFDPQGRLFVAVMPSYPHWKPMEEMNDKILILEDTDGDGRADKRTVFADKLHVPTGLEFYNGGLFVGQQPDLMFLKDTDRDDVADYRERMLHGIDSADTHHALNSFTLDPGGALYFQEGTFHHTQVETAYGPPERLANAGVFRYEPRTQKFDVYVSYSFANPHGHVFDRWGQDFVTDGTGNVNYFAAAFSGRIDFPRKHPGMEPIFQQRTRPCPATEILSSSHFPDELQGNYLVGNVIGFHGILQYRIEERESGFVGVEVEPIVQSADSNFRPTDMEIGPDGAIYFSDWQNPIIGHMQHNLRDPNRDRTHGRVYRITYPGRPLSKPAAIAGSPIGELVKLLASSEDRVRYRAKIELSARDSDAVIAAVNDWSASLDKRDPDYEHDLLETLWVHQHHNVVNQELLVRMLRSPDHRARAAATRVLCYWRDQVSDPLALLAEQVHDEHPRVRLEAVRACSFFRESKAAEVALQSVNHPRDYYINYTLAETMAQLEPYWKQAVGQGASFAADNPAGVDYILANVTTAELVNLPRTPLVYRALLSRDQVLHDVRHEAIMGLAQINQTDMLTELLAAIERMDQSDSPQADNVLSDLAHVLSMHAHDLSAGRDRIARLATDGKRAFTRQLGYMALVAADGEVGRVWDEAAKSLGTLHDLLDAVPLFPDAELRASAYERIEPLLFGLPPDLASQAEQAGGVKGRYVRIELPRQGTLTLAEVEVTSGGANISPNCTASQSSEGHGGAASRAIDGNKSGRYGDGGQTHTAENEDNPWWELDLGAERPIEAVAIYNRTEGNGQFAGRLDGFTLSVLDSARQLIYQQADNRAPRERASFELAADPTSTIRKAAMNAIVSTGADDAKTFATLAKFVRGGDERRAAVRAIGRIPNTRWPHEEVPPLIEAIVEHVGGLSADQRTTAAARDELQLANDLAAVLPSKQAQATRATLRELGVPVIVIRPVPHLMLYDRTQIYVEAGRPVEIVFENSDIMPHNLLIAQPGSLAKVGIEAEMMAADPNGFAKNFVPALSEVLHATRLLQPGQSDRLMIAAPDEPGEYPYVCTFPGHWRRMYGTMHVVKSLDDVPAEALLAAAPTFVATRPFVKAWSIEDLGGKLRSVGGLRNLARGKELFASVSCAQCHKLNGQGGQIGPDLATVKEKLAEAKATPMDVLTALIDPSKVIEEKYKTTVLELTTGQVVSGIVVEETQSEIRLRINPTEPGQSPDQPPDEVLSIPVEEIAERFPSTISLMPQGLLNTLSEEEIFDLMAYVMTGGG